jgi:hypothetical protein
MPPSMLRFVRALFVGLGSIQSLVAEKHLSVPSLLADALQFTFCLVTDDDFTSLVILLK